MITHVLIIADNCIKRRFIGKVTLVALPDIRQNICSVGGRQSVIFLKE